MLQVDHCRLGAGFPHLVCLVGVADQGDSLIAAPRQDPGKPQRDLTVTPAIATRTAANLRASLRRLTAPDAAARRLHTPKIDSSSVTHLRRGRPARRRAGPAGRCRS